MLKGRMGIGNWPGGGAEEVKEVRSGLKGSEQLHSILMHLGKGVWM